MNNKHCFFLLLIIALPLTYIGYSSYINQTQLSHFHKDNIEESPKTILIEVDKKTLSFVDRNSENIICTYTVATGKDTSPTPLGSFNIIQKAAWGEGFGSRWIGLDVPWGKYGIHGTNKPGSIGANVSAGCVRMKNSDVEELYSMINLNTKVLIINGDYGPFGNGFRTLKPGDRGADVLEVQKRLNQEGFYLGGFDGIYGENMKRALLDFLKDKNIPLTDKIDQNIYKELNIILMD